MYHRIAQNVFKDAEVSESLFLSNELLYLLLKSHFSLMGVLIFVSILDMILFFDLPYLTSL